MKGEKKLGFQTKRIRVDRASELRVERHDPEDNREFKAS